MKHSKKLIALFILTAINCIYNLFSKYKNYATLEEDVSNAYKKVLTATPDDIDIDTLPKWLVESIYHGAQHYQENGVFMFSLEVWGYALALVSVFLMTMNKKIGFWLYCLAQIIAMYALVYGFGSHIGTYVLVMIFGLSVYSLRYYTRGGFMTKSFRKGF